MAVNINNGFPRKELVEEIRKLYPAGTRVELKEMDDIQAPPVGTNGTVMGVDDIGSLLISWDNGSSLHALYGVDKVTKVDESKS